jgi:hypothetical protein
MYPTHTTYLLSVSGSLKRFDLCLNSTTTATLRTSKSCVVVNVYLVNMNLFFIILLYSGGSKVEADGISKLAIYFSAFNRFLACQK